MLIAQITDCHVTARSNGHPRLGDTAVFVAQAVDHLNTLRPQPDVVIATGDLCDPGDVEDYAVLRAALARIHAPVYLIPGNHDHRDRMRATFHDHAWLRQDPTFLHYVIDDFPVRLIGLDTIVPGEDGGSLCEDRLRWISDRLDRERHRPTFIFMHHPPVQIGMPFIDDLNCRGGEAFGQIVARHPQILAIACGHVHRPVNLAWCGTLLNTCPSTCYQFPLAMERDVPIVPCAEPRACRLYLWQNARLVSHLSYIP